MVGAWWLPAGVSETSPGGSAEGRGERPLPVPPLPVPPLRSAPRSGTAEGAARADQANCELPERSHLSRGLEENSSRKSSLNSDLDTSCGVERGSGQDCSL